MKLKSYFVYDTMRLSKFLSMKRKECGRKGKPRRCQEHGRESVSYTHLRAHETVLDLVCRLLLEKKKTIEMTVIVDILKI